MICMTTAVVANNIADVLRDRIHVADQLLDAFRFQIRLAGDRFVQIRDVSLMMLAVMNLHRLRVDVRFERIVWIRERRERMSHRSVLLSASVGTAELEGRTFAAIGSTTFFRGRPSSRASAPRGRRCGW